MTIAVAVLARVFNYNGVKLPDVPGMSNEDVKTLYAGQYPELLTAEVEVGEVVRGTQQINFRRAVGTKG
jgi:PRTRC genetic system protein C